MTLPGFPALALLVALITQGLGCRGAASLLLLTVTPVRSLLGTNFSERAQAARAGFLTASAKEREGFAVFLWGDTLFSISRRHSWICSRAAVIRGSFVALAEEGLEVGRWILI